jgi:hypothetical protein
MMNINERADFVLGSHEGMAFMDNFAAYLRNRHGWSVDAPEIMIDGTYPGWVFHAWRDYDRRFKITLEVRDYRRSDFSDLCMEFWILDPDECDVYNWDTATFTDGNQAVAWESLSEAPLCEFEEEMRAYAD